MGPKEYYQQSVIQEDKRCIFALIPPGFEEQRKTYIKESIERIKIENGSITCESNLDFEVGADNLVETRKSIQKAAIIVADITGLKPDVMLGLGMAMMKKKRVILIAEKSVGEEPNLIFDISTLGVEFYGPDNFDVFSRKLVNLVKKIMATEDLLLTPGKNAPMNKAPDRIASPRVLYKTGPSDAGVDLKIEIDKRIPGKQHTLKFKKEDESWENSAEMYAQIKDIDDVHGLAYLNCKYKKDSDNTFERIFPLKHFKNKNKLKVDQSILVKVYEKPGEVRFQFEEVDEDFFDKDVEDISINDPDYSTIFKPL